MKWGRFEILPIGLMEGLFGPPYCKDEFGSRSYILQVTSLLPPDRPLLVSTLGSAGDNGRMRERIDKYYPILKEHGAALGEFSRRRNDLGLVHVTGGPPGIPALIAKTAKESNPNLFSMALYPNFSSQELAHLAEGVLPDHLQHYDWIVVCNLSTMKRGVDVGKSPINLAYHGGEGTLLEIAEASHGGKIIVAVQIGSEFGIVNKIPDILALSYTDRAGIVFAETNPSLAIQRAVAEHFAKLARERGEVLSALDTYSKPDGRLYLNPRNPPNVTTDKYPNKELSDKLVVAGVDYNWLMDELVSGIGQRVPNVDGSLKTVQLREGESPHMLRGLPGLAEVINDELKIIRSRAIEGNAPYHLIHHNFEVPVLR